MDKYKRRKITYSQDLDNKLLQWILEKREECNVPVLRQAIQMKVLSIIKPIHPKFKASAGLFPDTSLEDIISYCSQKRKSLKSYLYTDLKNKIARFRQDVHFIQQNGDFPYKITANMGETPVFLDTVPTEKVNRKCFCQ